VGVIPNPDALGQAYHILRVSQNLIPVSELNPGKASAHPLILRCERERASKDARLGLQRLLQIRDEIVAVFDARR
jgi:hypothetical protein